MSSQIKPPTVVFIFNKDTQSYDGFPLTSVSHAKASITHASKRMAWRHISRDEYAKRFEIHEFILGEPSAVHNA